MGDFFWKNHKIQKLICTLTKKLHFEQHIFAELSKLNCSSSGDDFEQIKTYRQFRSWRSRNWQINGWIIYIYITTENNKTARCHRHYWDVFGWQPLVLKILDKINCEVAIFYWMQRRIMDRRKSSCADESKNVIEVSKNETFDFKDLIVSVVFERKQQLFITKWISNLYDLRSSKQKYCEAGKPPITLRESNPDSHDA